MQGGTELMSLISQLMEHEQLFLDSDLKLTDLATRLNTNRNVVSACINTQLGCFFSQFISNYRVEHAKQLLRQHGTAMFSSGGGQPLEEAYVGRPVESEWPDLFHGNATIKKVTLGKHAIGLSNSYFENCTSLETVVLGENINRIGDLAFFGCAKLKTVNLPEGITSIGHSAFTGCESLTGIKLPSTLTYIGDYAFTNMGLTKIVIPKRVEEIGVEGVSNWLLQTVVIEDGTTPLKMGHADVGSVFLNCKKLEKAYVGRNINTDASLYSGLATYFWK